MSNWGHILILLGPHLNPEPVGTKENKGEEYKWKKRR